MTQNAKNAQPPKEALLDLRAQILQDPSVVLEDMDIMRALVSAHDDRLGENIVDMRGLAMDRLEKRLTRLEDTHRSVISAAYENLAGTDQINRAVLRIVEADLDFETLLTALGEDVRDILRLSALRLVMETAQNATQMANLPRIAHLSIIPKGSIQHYIGTPSGLPIQRVSMRPVHHADVTIYGTTPPQVLSEACVQISLGSGRLPAMIVMGSNNADTFHALKGSRLLEFFADVFERQLLHILDQ